MYLCMFLYMIMFNIAVPIQPLSCQDRTAWSMEICDSPVCCCPRRRTPRRPRSWCWLTWAWLVCRRRRQPWRKLGRLKWQSLIGVWVVLFHFFFECFFRLLGLLISISSGRMPNEERKKQHTSWLNGPPRRQCPSPLLDVWSCGCLIFMLLSGRHPFDGDPGGRLLPSASPLGEDGKVELECHVECRLNMKLRASHGNIF